MQPKLTVIDNPQDLQTLKTYLEDKDFVAYDCETTGLLKTDRVIGFSICASEDEAFYVILEKWNTVTQKMEPTSYLLEARDIILDLETKKLVMHNAIFDCMMANSYFKIDLMPSVHTDTMILAHLLDENRWVGLKELGKSMFGENATQEQAEMKASVIANGGKLTQKNYEMYKADSYLLGKYGAKDAWLTYKIFMALVPELYEQGLDKFFYEDESMPLLKGPTYQLNSSGLKVDQNEVTILKKTLEAECAEAKSFIYSEIQNYVKEKYPGDKKGTTFNIGSSKQLAWLLFGQMKCEFGTLTDGGKKIAKHLGFKKNPYTKWEKTNFIDQCMMQEGQIYELEAVINGKVKKAKKLKQPWDYIACDKKTLTKIAPRYKWVAKLLEYQRKMKILNTYVKGIETRVQYGIIRPRFLQHGTTSGRYSSRDPNFQNLPRDDKRIKACIVARPGKVFVGADYSQLEPRVFAYYSKDPRLLAAFQGDDDFYSVIGMEVYDKFDCEPRKEGEKAFGELYPKLRNISKVIALASTYGSTAYQLHSTVGKSVEDTQQDIDNYFEKFPGVKSMMLEAHQLVKEQGFVTSLFGRPRRIPEAMQIIDLPHAELPYEARNLLNLAVNHRIQSTAASIVNRAAIVLDQNLKQAGISCNIVVQVHDSLVIECNEADADNVAILLQNAMEETTVLEGIRFEANPKVGRNLAEV